MFKFKEFIDGNEITIEGKWFHKGYEGNRVFIKGVILPKEGEYGHVFLVKKMNALLSGKDVSLFSPEFYEPFGKEILACYVYLNGINIIQFFPEFKRKI